MNTLIIFLVLNLGTSLRVDVGHGEYLNLVDAGQGDPIVLMPGLAGCSYSYRHVVPELEGSGFRAIIIEPLAYGFSAKPRQADYSFTAQARRVAASLDSLGVSAAVVVGHGVSVSIALRLALERPDLVQGIVSLEGGVRESAGTPGVDRSLRIAGLVAKLGGKRILRDNFRDSLEAASGDKTWVTKYNVRKYFAPAARDLDASIAALKAMAQAQEKQPLTPQLPQISCPVHLLTGQAPHEGGLSEEDFQVLAKGLSKFSHHQVPGVGHYLFEEAPAEVVQAVLTVHGQISQGGVR